MGSLAGPLLSLWCFLGSLFSIKEALFGWLGSVVGKAHKKTVVYFFGLFKKEEFDMVDNVDLLIQKMKILFIYMLWSWSMVCPEMDLFSPFSFH